MKQSLCFFPKKFHSFLHRIRCQQIFPVINFIFDFLNACLTVNKLLFDCKKLLFYSLKFRLHIWSGRFFFLWLLLFLWLWLIHFLWQFWNWLLRLVNCCNIFRYSVRLLFWLFWFLWLFWCLLFRHFLFFAFLRRLFCFRINRLSKQANPNFRPVFWKWSTCRYHMKKPR